MDTSSLLSLFHLIFDASYLATPNNVTFNKTGNVNSAHYHRLRKASLLSFYQFPRQLTSSTINQITISYEPRPQAVAFKLKLKGAHLKVYARAGTFLMSPAQIQRKLNRIFLEFMQKKCDLSLEEAELKIFAKYLSNQPAKLSDRNHQKLQYLFACTDKNFITPKLLAQEA